MRWIASAAALVLGLAVAACNGEVVVGGQRPAQLLVVSGDLQTDTVGKELAQPLVVRVVDDKDRPVRGQLVNFVVTAGGGSVFAGAALTNADGEARERWTLGTVAGDTQRVEARAVDPATGQAIVFATFRAIGVADVPATATILGSPARAGAAGTAIADSLVVKVVDRYGNSAAGVPVTFAAQNGGSVSPAATVTRADGTARAQWTLGTTPGPQTATASAGGSAVMTFTAQASAGSIARVVLSPDTLSFNAVGQTRQMTVQAFDAFNNAVSTQATIISQNAAVVALDAGAVARATGSGTARVIATVPGATAADTTVVTVTPVTVSIVATPVSATLTDADTLQIQATALDERGNPVPGVPFRYTASGPAVAVSATGLVTARAGGVDSVRVSSGAVGTWVRITVSARLRAITVDVGSLHACAVDPQERVYCWGRNPSGALGTGSTGGPERCRDGVPCHAVATRMLFSGAETVSVGGASTCLTSPYGSVYCAGDNSKGQLGDGTTVSQPYGHGVEGGGRFLSVSQGGSHACALNAANEVWCWGAGTAVGNGSEAGSTVPVRVGGEIKFYSVSAGADHSCAISAGRVYCWGENGSGQLGDGTYQTRTTPTLVPGVYSAMSLSAGTGNTCAVEFRGEAFCWGSNQFGALGTGSREISVPSAAPVAGNLTFSMISIAGIRACAVTQYSDLTPGSGYRAYCWGALEFTSSGNVAASSSTPEEVPGSVRFSTVVTGPESACGIDRSQFVRCWGRRSWGMLGDGVIPGAGDAGSSREPTYVRIRN